MLLSKFLQETGTPAKANSVQDKGNVTDQTADCLKGLRDRDGKLLGLLVRAEHAMQFIHPLEDLRKVY